MHLRVQTSGVPGRSPIDRRASQLGLRCVVGAMVPHFSLAAQILAQTDLLLTVPSVAMGNTATAFHLEQRELPFDLPDMGLSLFRSAAGGGTSIRQCPRFAQLGIRTFRRG